MTAATETPRTGFLERRFRLTERRTSLRAEAPGGFAPWIVYRNCGISTCSLPADGSQ